MKTLYSATREIYKDAKPKKGAQETFTATALQRVSVAQNKLRFNRWIIIISTVLTLRNQGYDL